MSNKINKIIVMKTLLNNNYEQFQVNQQAHGTEPLNPMIGTIICCALIFYVKISRK